MSKPSSNEDDWNEWSCINHTDWEELNKVYVAERIYEENLEYSDDRSSTESEEMSDIDEASDWSSDDSRLDMNLQQLKKNIRYKCIDKE